MKNAISFQLWLVNDVLHNLKKYDKVNNKIKIKKILLLQKYNEKLKKLVNGFIKKIIQIN